MRKMDNVLELSNAEIRSLAAEKIREKGKANLKYECRDTGALCMMGAIRKVIFGTTDILSLSIEYSQDIRITRYREIIEELNAELPEDFRRGEDAVVRIGLFNDTNDRYIVVDVLAGKSATARDV